MGRKKPVGLEKSRAVYGYLFILPFILGFVFFMIKPLWQSFMMSLSDVQISNSGFQNVSNHFENYKRAFLIDPEFNRMLVENISAMLYRSLATIVFIHFSSSTGKLKFLTIGLSSEAVMVSAHTNTLSPFTLIEPIFT